MRVLGDHEGRPYKGRVLGDHEGGPYKGRVLGDHEGGAYKGCVLGDHEGGAYKGRVLGDQEGRPYKGRVLGDHEGGAYKGRVLGDQEGGPYKGRVLGDQEGGPYKGRVLGDQGGGPTMGDLIVYNLPMPGSVFDFTDFIAERTADFVGRQWVFEAIDDWLRNPGAQSYFIITGGPGVGKSAIAARLTQQRELAAYHFCMARDRRTVDPVSFAEAISFQLCRIDGFANAILKESKYQIENVQQVAENRGTIIGTQIRSLTINARSGSEAFTDAVLNPLRTLYARGFQEPLLILVDALDEAVQHTGQETIVDLLADAGRLPGPVRFVLTTRPESAALRHFEHRDVPYFLLDTEREENLRDIRAYVNGRLAAVADLCQRVQESGIAEEAFVDRITRRSEGNFLYVVWLLPAIAAGSQRFDSEHALPKGLDGIYREFLRTRKLGREAREWRRLYRPVLGVLAAAQAPLSREQAAMFSGLSKQDTTDCLLDVRQFLDPGDFAQEKYRLYHLSISDFLTDEARAAEFWIDLEPVHQGIIAHYRDGADTWRAVDWTAVDDYGLLYLAGHLYEAARRDPLWRNELYGLMCRSLMLAKRERSGSDHAFAEDLLLAIRAAAAEQPANWPQLFRHTLAYATLGTLAANMPAVVLGALAATGQVGRARGYLDLIQENDAKLQAMAQVTDGLITSGHNKEALELLAEAQHVAVALANAMDRDTALIWISQRLAACGAIDDAEHVARSVTPDWNDSWALSSLATELRQQGQLEDAQRIAGEIPEGWQQASALIAVAEGWLGAGDLERAMALLPQIFSLPLDSEAAEELLHHLDEQGARARALALITPVIEQERDFDRLQFLVNAWLAAGQPQEAMAIALRSENEWLHRYAAEVVIRYFLEVQPAAQLREAVALAAQIPEYNGQAGALVGLLDWATALADEGRPGQAVALTEQILEVAAGLTTAENRFWVLGEVVRCLYQLEKREMAEELLGQCLAEAAANPDPFWRAWGRIVMAQTLCELGQPQRAARLLEETAADLPRIESVRQRVKAEAQLAIARAYTGETAGAAGLLQTIFAELADETDGNLSRFIYSQAVGALAWLGRVDAPRAIEVAQNIVDRETADLALTFLASSLAHEGDVAQAEAIAGMLPEPGVSQVRQGIVEGFIRRDELAAAHSAALGIGEDWTRGEMLFRTSRRFLGLAYEEGPERAAQQAREITPAEQRASLLSYLASGLDERVGADAIMGIWDWALQELPELYDADRHDLLLQAAGGVGLLIDRGDLLQAGALAARVTDQAAQLKGQRARDEVFGSLAMSLTTEMPAAADAALRGGLLTQAAFATQQVEEAERRALLIGTLAEAMVAAGQTQRAADLLEQALAATRQIPAQREKEEALVAVSEALATVGACNLAAEVAVSLIGQGARAKGLSAVAFCRARSGDVLVEEAVRLAKAAAADVSGRMDQVIVYGDLARAYNALGEERGQILAENKGAKLATQFKPAYLRAPALSHAACVAADLGYMDHASHLAQDAVEAARAVQGAQAAMGPLSAAAKGLHAAGENEEALQVMEEAAARLAEIRGDQARAEALGDLLRGWAAIGERQRVQAAAVELEAMGTAAGATARAELSLARHWLGSEEEAAATFKSTLALARGEGRKSVFAVLATGAPLLAGLDQGTVLAAVCEHMAEVDRWWGG